MPRTSLSSTNTSDPAQSAYTRARIAHWDAVASQQGSSTWNRAYHQLLRQVYRSLVPVGQRVLEIRCGRGDLLAALEPSTGVGVDFSARMLHEARQRHSGLRFVQADAHAL